MALGEGEGDPSAEHPTPSSSSPRPISHSRLHNFQLPGWNTHRLLRCGNPGASFTGQEVDAGTSAARPWNLRKRRMACGAPAKRKFPPSSSRSSCPSSGDKEAAAAMVALAVARGPATPWNLRTRNSWKKAGLPPLPKSMLSVSPDPASMEKGGSSMRLKSEGREKDKEKWPKISLRLSKKEIKEDFFILTGKKPSGRPKKRPKSVQKRLDSLFPGNLLSKITLDLYKIVNEGTKW